MFQKSVNREFKSRQFMHLAESFKIWLETLGYKAKTIKLINWNITEFFAFLERNGTSHLKDFQSHHVTQYLEYLAHRPNCIKPGSLNPNTINKHVTTLRLFSKYLGQTNKSSLVIKPELFKTTQTATYLSQTEIKALYKAASNENNIYHQRDTAMMGLFYGCALRASEGEALNIGDILFERNLVYVRKGKNYRERYVPLSKQVKNDLKNYITDQRNALLQPLGGDSKTEALLLGRGGTRWSVHGMYARLQLLKSLTGS